MVAPGRDDVLLISVAGIRARSTTGLANVIELLKRNEPRLGVSRSVSQAATAQRSTRRIPLAMTTSTWVRAESASDEAAAAEDSGAGYGGELAFHLRF
jgi:hypothetical protein